VAYSDTITDGPHARLVGHDLRITWASSSPPGTTFQVYLDRRLAWSGKTRTAHLPPISAPALIEVVAVDPGEDRVDHSGSFDPVPGRAITVEWSGGRFLSDSLLAFDIYLSPAPGQPVSYAKPVSVAWAAHGVAPDGYGIGGYGQGGYGMAEVRYSWTSKPLAPGVWTVGIVARDATGIPGAAAESSVTLAGPPRAPAAVPGQPRLSIVVNPATRVPTLSWAASPG
jgi:hypothetical protein